MKYILFLLILTLGTISSFAEADGNTVRETTAEISLRLNLLVPEVPRLATFDETEAESIALLLMGLAGRFAPTVPQEATFDEVVPANGTLAPVVPLEATFNDTP